MSNIRDVVDGQVVEETPKEISNTKVTQEYKEGLTEQMAIAQVLGLDNLSEISKYDDQIKTIMDWANLEGFKDAYELKNMVRQLQDRLGSPPITEKWISRVSRYAHLVLETNKLEAEKAKLTR